MKPFFKLSGALLGLIANELIGIATRIDTGLFISLGIVILGEYQIPFGSGPPFLEFFENIKAHCPPTPKQ